MWDLGPPLIPLKSYTPHSIPGAQKGPSFFEAGSLLCLTIWHFKSWGGGGLRKVEYLNPKPLTQIVLGSEFTSFVLRGWRGSPVRLCG